jgi:hypothetical protein
VRDVRRRAFSTDQIGDYGELLAAVELSRPVPGRFKRPLFKPVHLGGKYPAVDYIVDVLGPNARNMGFFFLQVKSTARGHIAGNRLGVFIKRDSFNALAALCAPSYLIGVDTRSETCHIVAANKPVLADVPGIAMAYNLADDDVKIALYWEVVGFWRQNRRSLLNTRFPHV